MDTDAVLRLMQEVAAEVIDPRFRSLSEGEIDEKGPGDLVTAADREAEVLITRVLRAAYPDAVILGEETYAEQPGPDGRVPGRPTTRSPSTRSTAPRTSSTARPTMR